MWLTQYNRGKNKVKERMELDGNYITITHISKVNIKSPFIVQIHIQKETIHKRYYGTSYLGIGNCLVDIAHVCCDILPPSFSK
jgi:hypothetical protein